MNLEFVGPEEAAKWPEGTWCICAKVSEIFPPTFWNVCRIDRVTREMMAEPSEYNCTHFLRLPDSLPEIERNE